MNRIINIEAEVIRMGDVGTAITMMDVCIAEGDADQIERASVILRELFVNRYQQLQRCLYGGGESNV